MAAGSDSSKPALAPPHAVPRGNEGSRVANQSAAIPGLAPGAARDAQPQSASADDDWLGGFNRFRLLAGLAAAIGLVAGEIASEVRQRRLSRSRQPLRF